MFIAMPPATRTRAARAVGAGGATRAGVHSAQRAARACPALVRRSLRSLCILMFVLNHSFELVSYRVVTRTYTYTHTHTYAHLAWQLKCQRRDEGPRIALDVCIN